MPVYCSNFYGYTQCHLKVDRFGDRCHSCIRNGLGKPMKEGLLPRDIPVAKPPIAPLVDDADSDTSSASSRRGSA